MYDFRPMTADDITADDLPLVRRWLATGVPCAVTDPTNARAIRCTEKAGLARDRLVDTPDGVALLMIRNASSQ